MQSFTLWSRQIACLVCRKSNAREQQSVNFSKGFQTCADDGIGVLKQYFSFLFEEFKLNH